MLARSPRHPPRSAARLARGRRPTPSSCSASSATAMAAGVARGRRTAAARHQALAADHATLVDAFTRLGEASGQARWIDEARTVADTMLDHFWDLHQGGLFTVAEDGEQLVVRQKDLLDNATPSANSIAANALYRLGVLTGEARYEHHADQIMQLLGSVIGGAPTAFANALAAVDMRRAGITEVAVVGDRPTWCRRAARLPAERRAGVG